MADATQTYDLYKAVHAFLPTEAVCANGDRIPLTWHDAAEGTTEGVAYPFGTFRIRGETMVDRTSRNYGFREDASTFGNQVDNFTYVSGVSDYLVEGRDIMSINSATGDKGSGPEALTLDVDFEVVASDDYEFMLDTIRILNPLVDASTFTIDYEHRLIAEIRENHTVLPVSLVLRVQDLANGTNGATKNYAKTHLAQQVADYVLAHLRTKQGVGLLPSAPGDLRVGRAATVGVNEFDPSDSERKVFIEMFLNKRTKILFDSIEYIRDADAVV